MVYGWFLRRQVRSGWEALSRHDVDAIAMHDDVRFTFAGEHDLAAETTSADELRAWLRTLFERFPRLEFVPDEIVVGGPPWAIKVATRYRAVQDGRTIYAGAQFALVRNGKLVEEYVLPDTQALTALPPS